MRTGLQRRNTPAFRLVTRFLLRRSVYAACSVLFLLSATAYAADAKLGPAEFKADFETACREIASTYAYFDKKATTWREITQLYAADLGHVTTRAEFVGLLENVVDELYDPHSQLNTNTPSSWRLVPSGTDLWAEWRDGKATITQVRSDSDAARGGLKVGAIIVSINNEDIAAVVNSRMGRSYPHSTPGARDWALRSVLAGRHGVARTIKFREGSLERSVTLPAADQFRGERPLIAHSLLKNGVGYIRFNDSLGNNESVAAFDKALEQFKSTRALIIDLRDTGSGGNTTVARGVLGRFVKREIPYQKHELTSEEQATGVHRSWLELVAPRGAFTYEKPVAVLVNRWTGSMGEGIAIGFNAAIKAKIIGTSMAQLVGATYSISLPHSGIGINVPAERVYHVDGTPREMVRPTIEVAVDEISGEDPFIAAAVRAFEK